MSSSKETQPVAVAASARKQREPQWWCIVASLALIFFAGAVKAQPPGPDV
ncbi:MAG TPA: hypothetical protein VFA39_02105 [Steroidobacteraceae bacterium]|nr:hypothetical protein [Steroidobacteraceae bacterium]